MSKEFEFFFTDMIDLFHISCSIVHLNNSMYVFKKEYLKNGN